MTEMATIEKKMRRTVQVRASFRAARGQLGLRGNLLTLILCSILLLVVAFTAYFTASALALSVEMILPKYEMLPDVVFLAALVLFVAFVFLPLAFGYARLALLMENGETPTVRELIAYIDTPTRYFDVVTRGVLGVVSVAIPLLLAVAVLFGAGVICTEILTSAMAADLAVRYVALTCAVAALLALGMLLLESFALPVAFSLLKHEKRNPFAALLCGWRWGARCFGKNLLFLLAVLWRAIVGLATLELLWLLWHAPLVSVAYIRYCEEIA